jgi:ABC-2 type transport system ATP-binding protein
MCDFIFLIDHGRKVLDGPLAEVRRSGDQAIRLDYDGDASFVRQLPGVQRFNDAGKSAEIFLEPGGDPQALLAELVKRVRVRRFDLRDPSLHEVFVRAVGGKQRG